MWLIYFSSFLVELYCFIHNLVSVGEEQDLDICSAIAQCVSNLWYGNIKYRFLNLHIIYM